MFCIPKSCRQCFWIMLLAQCAQCFGHILPLFRTSWKKCAHWVLHSKLVCGFSVMLLAPIMKVVCPLGFAFQLCMRIVFKSCFRHTVPMVSATLCYTLLPIMKLVCPLSFAFQICLQIVSQSCFWHTVRMDSATLCYFAAHHESSVPIGFCLRCCVFWWLPWLSFSCVPMVLPWLLVACRDLGRLPSSIELCEDILQLLQGTAESIEVLGWWGLDL